MVKRLVAAIALLFCVSAPSRALDRAHYRELQRKAAKLAQGKDWAGFKQALMEIGHELPGDTPNQMLRMASVEMHLGNKMEALRWMQKYAAAGLSYDVATDEDLAPLAKDPEFSSVATKMEANRKPIQNAELVCSIPIPDLMPEDLTYVPAKKSFFVSSVQHHSLFRITPPKSGGKTECGATEIPLPAEAKRWPTLAVSWDTRRSVVWLSTSAMPGFSGFPKEDSGKAALLAVDPASGKLLRRLDLSTEGPAVLGDMTIAFDGAVYISDSIGGGV